MGLFNVLPENLFSILSSPNRRLYVEALFMLRKAFKNEYAIARELLHAMISDRLGEMDVSWQKDDESDETASTAKASAADETGATGGFSAVREIPPAKPVNSSDLSRLLMRRLEETGWLETEYKQDSFDEQITLPPYAISLLDLLYSFTEESRQEYGRHAFLTYTLLKSASQIQQTRQSVQEADESWMAIEQAAREAENLQDALKSLLNNIRRYHRQLNEYLSTTEILQGHFDQFQILVNERVYHPLKTRDAVQRYKIPILGFCEAFLADADFMAAAGQAATNQRSGQQADNNTDVVLLAIRKIADIFDQVEELLADIDSKNRAYTRASTDKLVYLLSEDENIRGCLIRIIGSARHLPPDRQQLFLDSPVLTRQSYLNHDSLYLRATRHVYKDAVPLAIPTGPGGSENDPTGQRQAAVQDFLRHAASRYSHEQIIQYIMDLLGDQDKITSADIPLNSDEDFIMAMLGALKGSERQTPYRVEFSAEGRCVRHGIFTIPEITITSRRSNADKR